MAARKPKVGDAAIIDGEECQITAINDKTTEFKCLERLAMEEEVAALRAMPFGTKEEQAASNTAKEKWMAEYDAAIGDKGERARLAGHGHTGHGCGGTVTAGRNDMVFFVEPAQAWSLYGRLLPRADIVETHTVDGVVCDKHDENGDCIILTPSVRRRAGIHRVQGQAYDPLLEVAAHVAHNGGAS
jgi:hypothetical protein